MGRSTPPGGSWGPHPIVRQLLWSWLVCRTGSPSLLPQWQIYKGWVWISAPTHCGPPHCSPLFKSTSNPAHRSWAGPFLGLRKQPHHTSISSSATRGCPSWLTSWPSISSGKRSHHYMPTTLPGPVTTAILFQLYDHPAKSILSLHFFRKEDRGSEKLRGFSKITQPFLEPPSAPPSLGRILAQAPRGLKS